MMDIKSEEDVLDELKSANLFIPPEITITPVSSYAPYDASSSSYNKQQSPVPTKKAASGSERSKYAQLLSIIEEIGKDIRPSYTGSKSSSERLKRSIMNARVLVRECLTEVERSAHMGFKLLQNWKTDHCADSVEWCPLEPYQNYFVCGTYELQNPDDANKDEKQQVRLGQLLLFSVLDDLKIFLHSTTDTTGILDCKWFPELVNDSIILISANADGKLIIWRLKHDENIFMEQVSDYSINDKNILSLSLDMYAENDDCKICISDSAGYITILNIDRNLNCVVINKLKIHDYEAWVVTFNAVTSSQILSGADDCLLKITDLKSGKLITQLKEHGSGVTSIRFNPLKPHIFVSGSYDESIRLWDIRNTSKSLSSQVLGGGIWRIKWDLDNCDHILIAAMYSGFFWLNYSASEDTVTTKYSFDEHESIAYGADINHMSPTVIKQKYFHDKYEYSDVDYKLTVTCSFYDKKICFCLI